MDIIKRCWAEISIDNLLSNLSEIREKVTNTTEIMCVVKANAYGHGDGTVVRELEAAGVHYFAVAAADEAAHLRSLGVKAEIIILGACLDDCFSYASQYDITLSVCDREFAKSLSDYACSLGKTVKVHIKLNTGMSRVGFDCLDADQALASSEEIEKIKNLPGLDVCGIFTHFSVSDEQDGVEYTAYQFENFMRMKKILENKGVYIKTWHCANSGAIVNRPECCMDMVRAGIILYGVYDSYGVNDVYKPVLSLKTVITQIRKIHSGTSVSYGRMYTADSDIDTAVISIGYGDGYPRSLSGKGRVLINGKYAPILGRVCMDQTIVDITGIDCKVGDVVTVIGFDGKNEVSVNELAQIDCTINYEILCGIALRVPRLYFKNGIQTDVLKYL